MKKHITIGIAGHVDHGKTSLVEAMTGIFTDRLQEEKRRGLSIESGVAPMDISSGGRVALMDVPGHTDFLKNTIRGLSNVDAAVLVVAADDGVMPQTREHMEILRYFGTRNGFVVLSKADLVDEEILYLAELEIRELLAGSFLENCAVIPFSAKDRRGLDEIRIEIERLVETSPEKDVHVPFRLWIDQVKSFPGFGTVVSGTIASGKLAEGHPVQILPGGLESRVRSLESHHKKTGQVEAGQRAGVNLHKVSAKEIRRGMVLTEPGSIIPSNMLNVEIRAFKGARSVIKNRQRVKLYLGTSVSNALVVLMDKEYLAPGDNGLAQIRLMKPLSALPRDPFVLCPLNIQSVLGGGKVLEVTREKYRAVKSSRIIPGLRSLQAGDLKTFMDYLLGMECNDLLDSRKLMLGTGLPVADIQSELETRIRGGELLSFGNRGAFPNVRFKYLKGRVQETVKDIFSCNPLKKAAAPEEIKKKLAPSLDDMPFQRILSELCNEGKLIKQEGGFRVPDLSVKLSDERERLIAMLLDYARDSDFVPFSADTFWKRQKRKHNKNEIQRLLDFLNTQGRLIRLNNRRFMTPQAMSRIKIRVKEVIRRNGVLTIGDCKDVLGYGRTVGIPVFEYLDSIGFTRREGDTRTLR